MVANDSESALVVHIGCKVGVQLQWLQSWGSTAVTLRKRKEGRVRKTCLHFSFIAKGTTLILARTICKKSKIKVRN